MAPDSNTLTRLPSGPSGSTTARILLLGLIARNAAPLRIVLSRKAVPLLAPDPNAFPPPFSNGRPRVPRVLTAQHRLWNVCPSADRLRPQPAPRAQRLAQISLPRPPCRNHSQT